MYLDMPEEPLTEHATAQEPLLLTLNQASILLNLGRTTIYRLINQEGLPVMRFGRAVRIHPVHLREWLEQREQPLPEI
jgi:excisionase family DNA binding protein